MKRKYPAANEMYIPPLRERERARDRERENETEGERVFIKRIRCRRHRQYEMYVSQEPHKVALLSRTARRTWSE